MTRLQERHETTKGQFKRARCARIHAVHDEPPAKRLARSNSTSSIMSLVSESRRSNESESGNNSDSMSLGSESSQSDDSENDGSSSDADERDE